MSSTNWMKYTLVLAGSVGGAVIGFRYVEGKRAEAEVFWSVFGFVFFLCVEKKGGEEIGKAISVDSRPRCAGGRREEEKIWQIATLFFFYCQKSYTSCSLCLWLALATAATNTCSGCSDYSVH